MSNLISGAVLFVLSFQLFANALPGNIPIEGLQAEKNGDLQRAIAIYTNFLLKNKSDAELWLKVASLEYRLKNYTLAINAYRHAVQIDPNNPLTYKKISELYVELNQPDKALEEIKKAVALRPDNADYLLSKAQLANWNNQAAMALESYQQMLALKRKANPDFDATELLIQIAPLQGQLHHYGDAIVTWEQLTHLRPSASVYNSLAQNYAAVNQPEKALDAINKALQLEPGNKNFLQAKSTLNNWVRNKTLASELKPVTNPVATQLVTHSVSQAIKSAFPQQGKTPGPFELSIAEANDAAMSHHYAKAAIAMRQAIQLKPGDATLYKKLSEIYANARQPNQALNALNQALSISPNNIVYLRSRAQLAAWANDKIQMQDSYERILKQKPNDQNALLNLAFTYSWKGETDRALKAYRHYLSIYPNDPEGWIQYAEPLSWIEAYKPSMHALERYLALKGDKTRYLKIRARVLASAGYFQSARIINEPLLQKKPEDPYLLSTEVSILTKGLQTKKAVATLKKLHQLHPDYFQLRGLDNITLTPLRSNINLGANYTSASDTTRVMQVPTLQGQYFLSPATSLLIQGLDEQASADIGSGLETIDGTRSIADESLMIGLATQIPKIANLRGQVGNLKIQNKNNHFIYDGLINTNLHETAQLTVNNSYNLYRPYLIPQSPRLISLQIMENRTGGYLQWQPFIQKYLNAFASYSTLSDQNSYWHTTVWPKARVFSSQYWQVSSGVNFDSWRYKKRVVNQGYYAPLNFQSYQGTVEAYYAISENMGCSLSGGFGIQKDETFPTFYYGEDLAAQLFLGIFTDWQLRINGGYTLRKNPDGSYRSWNTGLILTRRL